MNDVLTGMMLGCVIDSPAIAAALNSPDESVLGAVVPRPVLGGVE